MHRIRVHLGISVLLVLSLCAAALPAFAQSSRTVTFTTEDGQLSFEHPEDWMPIEFIEEGEGTIVIADSILTYISYIDSDGVLEPGQLFITMFRPEVVDFVLDDVTETDIVDLLDILADDFLRACTERS